MVPRRSPGIRRLSIRICATLSVEQTSGSPDRASVSDSRLRHPQRKGSAGAPHELNNKPTTFDPYVQRFSRGTLNVGNDDRLLHTNRFITWGRRGRRHRPFNDGEVSLSSFQGSGTDRCGVGPASWARRGSLFDHPYYARTAASGTFSIDGIPPGRYLVRAWHPSLGVADDSVTVPAGQQVSVAFRLRPKASATGAPAPAPPISEPVILPSIPAASTTPTAATSTPTMIGPPPPR